MRIVGGKHRGKRLASPEGRLIRPTSDRVREAVFNILAHGSPALPEGAEVLDVFAGTGALGLEALSRGAARTGFIENNHHSLVCLTDNIKSLGEGERTSILRRSALHPGPAPRACDLAFLDPPYHQALAGSALQALADNGWLADGATLVVELGADETLEPPEGFEQTDQRGYGATRVIYLRWRAQSPGIK